MRPRFWELPLAELDAVEWESLCDGCGKCCLHKLEDEESGELHYTRVACRFLDADDAPRQRGGSPANPPGAARCRVYSTRRERVPECVALREYGEEAYRWLPSTCSYRLRAEGKPLPSWHPLIANDHRALQLAGVSVRGRVVSEENVHPDSWDEHVVRWV